MNLTAVLFDKVLFNGAVRTGKVHDGAVPTVRDCRILTGAPAIPV
jgi:hypothetical protein